MSDFKEVNNFFSKEELQQMTNYQKLRFENQIEKYRKMEKLGCHPAKPDFMLREVKSKQLLDKEKGAASEDGRKITKKRQRKPPKCSDDEDVEWQPEVKIKIPKMARKKTRKAPAQSILSPDIQSENSGPTTSGTDDRYPKRNRSIPDYKEAYVPDCDDFIYCDECEREWEGECDSHPLHIVVDNPVPINESDDQRAIKTTPSMLKVDISKIPNAGDGVWAREVIPCRTRFGPYEGRIVPADVSTGYGWQIRKNGKENHCVDASEPGLSNWMRYVNCSRHVQEQNLQAYQYRGSLYYRTTRQIAPLEELLVYYGNSYGQDLGIKPEEYHAETKKPLEELAFKCPSCYLSFSCPIFMGRHRCKGKRALLKELQNKEVPSKIKKFACEHCPARFIWKSHLEIHVRIHTGEKPFACVNCSARFTQGCHLTIHQRIHSGEMPLKCSNCSKSFRNQSNLATHIRIHTGDKRYGCPKCTARFTDSSNVRSHLKRHHHEKS